MRRGLALLVVCAAAVLAAAAPARAADFEVGMEDEGLLLSNQHLAPAAVLAWRSLGVDVAQHMAVERAVHATTVVRDRLAT